MFSKLAFVAAVAAPLIFAQDLSGLPTCAETPAIAALGSTGCSITDIKCICDDTSFLQSLEPAVAAVCSPADLATALQFAVNLCLSAGVTLTISTPAATTLTITSTASTVAAVTTTTAVITTPASTAAVTTAPAVTSTLATVTTAVAPVSEFTDGQPQQPTNATTIALPTVTPFKGAADNNKAQGAIVGLLAAVGVFVAL